MRTLFSRGTAATLLIFFSAVVLAESGEHGDHGIPWRHLIIPQAVNLALFIGVIVYYTKNIVVGYFSGRTKQFEEATRSAMRAKEEAERKHREIERKLADLQASGRAEVQKAAADAKALGVTLVEGARAQAHKIQAEAEAIVKAEWQRSVMTLKTETLSKSIGHAEDQLRTTGQASARSLQKAFVDRVQGARP